MRQITLTIYPFSEVYSLPDFDGEAVERSPITSTSAVLTYNKSGTPVVQTPAFDCLHLWKIKLILSADRHSLLLALVAEHHRRIRQNTGGYLVALFDECRPFVEPAPRSRLGGDLLTTTSPDILKYFAQFSVVLAIVEVVQVAGRKGVDPYWQVELSATEIATVALSVDPSWIFDTAGINADLNAKYPGASVNTYYLWNAIIDTDTQLYYPDFVAKYEVGTDFPAEGIIDYSDKTAVLTGSNKFFWIAQNYTGSTSGDDSYSLDLQIVALSPEGTVTLERLTSDQTVSDLQNSPGLCLATDTTALTIVHGGRVTTAAPPVNDREWVFNSAGINADLGAKYPGKSVQGYALYQILSNGSPYFLKQYLAGTDFTTEGSINYTDRIDPYPEGTNYFWVAIHYPNSPALDGGLLYSLNLQILNQNPAATVSTRQMIVSENAITENDPGIALLTSTANVVISTSGSIVPPAVVGQTQWLFDTTGINDDFTSRYPGLSIAYFQLVELLPGSQPGSTFSSELAYIAPGTDFTTDGIIDYTQYVATKTGNRTYYWVLIDNTPYYYNYYSLNLQIVSQSPAGTVSLRDITESDSTTYSVNAKGNALVTSTPEVLLTHTGLIV